MLVKFVIVHIDVPETFREMNSILRNVTMLFHIRCKVESLNRNNILI